MPITKVTDWNKWVEANQDPYGKCCVDVARHAMDILDERGEVGDPHQLICDAEKRLPETEQGITGFMAGAAAQMISNCHSQGDEFRRAWNLKYQIHDEGERANESGGILNPALMTIQ
jgi:hypothetical protein